MEDQEKALIKLGEDHIRLVEILRKALLLGQMGFLKAGQTLAQIKEKKTYRGEDLAHEWTWNDFCARPDLPFPGRTPESRRRTADALIRIFRVFKEKYQLPNNELAEIGWTKLDLIAPVCEKEQKETIIREWIEKARALTVTDLILMIKGKGEPVICEHEDAYWLCYCPKCGARSPNELNKTL